MRLRFVTPQRYPWGGSLAGCSVQRKRGEIAGHDVAVFDVLAQIADRAGLVGVSSRGAEVIGQGVSTSQGLVSLGSDP